MSRLFKVVAYCLAIVILTVVNGVALRRHTQFPVEMNVFAVACLIPNGVLIKRRTIAIGYALFLAVGCLAFLVLGLANLSRAGELELREVFLALIPTALFLSPSISVVLRLAEEQRKGNTEPAPGRVR